MSNEVSVKSNEVSVKSVELTQSFESARRKQKEQKEQKEQDKPHMVLSSKHVAFILLTGVFRLTGLEGVTDHCSVIVDTVRIHVRCFSRSYLMNLIGHIIDEIPGLGIRVKSDNVNVRYGYHSPAMKQIIKGMICYFITKHYVEHCGSGQKQGNDCGINTLNQFIADHEKSHFAIETTPPKGMTVLSHLLSTYSEVKSVFAHLQKKWNHVFLKDAE